MDDNSQKNIDNNIDLSIIIVSWNVCNLLEECLQSIYNSEQSITYEVILIDNASTDGTREMLESKFPELEVEYNKTNKGLAKPWNRGAKRAQGKYLLFLNDDTEIFDHTLDKCVKYYKNNPQTAILGCKLFNPDRTIQESVRRLPKLFDQAMIFLKIPYTFPQVLNKYLRKGFDYTKTQTVEQVMGSFFFMSKQIFTEFGGFDEKFFIWFEEADFCKRVLDKNYNVVYFSEAEAIHYGGASFKQVFLLRTQILFFKSAAHYFYKHHQLFK